MIDSKLDIIKAKNVIVNDKGGEFSALDLACFPMILRGTWVFKGDLDFEKMKSSLESLLSYYPRLAGKIKDKKRVEITNDGVQFEVAEGPDVLVENIDNETKTIDRFCNSIPENSLMSVKVTKVKNGTVLSVLCSHVCMDGDSFYSMVNNWGKLYRGEKISEPVFDQSKMFDYEKLPIEKLKKMALENGWKQLNFFLIVKLILSSIFNSSKLRVGPFFLSKKKLDLLKNEIGKDNGFECSTNIALSALITKLGIELFGLSKWTKCQQITVVDMRERLSDVGSLFCGNASITVGTRMFEAGSSISEIAKIIFETISPVLKNPSEKLELLNTINLNIMAKKLPFIPFDVVSMNSKKPSVFYTNNFSKLPIYEADFGTGCPYKVIPHDLPDPIVIWPANKDKNGIELYFSGVFAKKIKSLKSDDPWFKEIEQFGK